MDWQWEPLESLWADKSALQLDSHWAPKWAQLWDHTKERPLEKQLVVQWELLWVCQLGLEWEQPLGNSRGQQWGSPWAQQLGSRLAQHWEQLWARRMAWPLGLL